MGELVGSDSNAALFAKVSRRQCVRVIPESKPGQQSKEGRAGAYCSSVVSGTSECEGFSYTRMPTMDPYIYIYIYI